MKIRYLIFKPNVSYKNLEFTVQHIYIHLKDFGIRNPECILPLIDTHYKSIIVMCCI